MKQLTIYCSRDLEEMVIAALDRHGAEGYFRIAGATGNKFLPEGTLPRTITWEAVALTVPALPEKEIPPIVADLEAHADACDIRPCLRNVTLPIDQAW